MGAVEAEAVDLVHLDRYTGGDRTLNEEVLRLFDSQCEELTAALDDADAYADAQLWHQVTHTLKGASKGIGAHVLAAFAAEAEKIEVADAEARKRSLERIKGAMAKVQAFVANYLSQAAA